MSDYLNRIAYAATPEDAAHWIRAQATFVAATLPSHSPADRLSIVIEANQRAATLERPFEDGDGNTVAKPWRRWLREWGYPVATAPFAAEPFCACGRQVSECDGSRRGCGARKGT